PVSYGYSSRRGEVPSLLPPLPPTAGSGLGPRGAPGGPWGPPSGASPWGGYGGAPGGPWSSSSSSSSSPWPRSAAAAAAAAAVHPKDPRAAQGPWRGASPPPEFFAARMQLRNELQRQQQHKLLRKEQRKALRRQQQREINRREQPPFLLRVFCRLDSQHSVEEFRVRGQEPVQDELQVYAWMDTRLREICYLIKDVCAEARDRRALWHFRLCYPDKEGQNVFADVGMLHSIIPDPKEDSRTLADVKFQVGDFLVLSIIRKQKTNKKLAPHPDPKLQMQEGWEFAPRPSVLQQLPPFAA
ncbi:Histone deacetylase complex subunit SAP18, related, partial [Eimeria tenella]